MVAYYSTSLSVSSNTPHFDWEIIVYLMTYQKMGMSSLPRSNYSAICLKTYLCSKSCHFIIEAKLVHSSLLCNKCIFLTWCNNRGHGVNAAKQHSFIVNSYPFFFILEKHFIVYHFSRFWCLISSNECDYEKRKLLSQMVDIFQFLRTHVIRIWFALPR